jgi:hypothetical protein
MIEDICAAMHDAVPVDERLAALALLAGFAAHDDMERTLTALDNIKAALQRLVTGQ